jgi:hypothetical protein
MKLLLDQNLSPRLCDRLADLFPGSAHVDLLGLNRSVKTTRYFEEQVLVRRPYLQREWCERTIGNSIRKELQPDGRIRHWCFIEEIGKYLRVVTLEDGETILNAFPDRNFKES